MLFRDVDFKIPNRKGDRVTDIVRSTCVLHHFVGIREGKSTSTNREPRLNVPNLNGTNFKQWR